VDNGWEEVYAAHYRRLVALVAAVSGSPSEAEEAVQEAFVRALGLSGHRAVVQDPEAWLYQVAVNIARSRWRRIATGRRYAGHLAARNKVAQSELEQTDSRLALLAALRRLPFEQREALALHYLADLPIEAIGVRIGAPIGTVKARLSRGRAALAKLLAEDSTVEDRHA
jgi:RNA polymerase sigma-70 factor (ECF subfamily)